MFSWAEVKRLERELRAAARAFDRGVPGARDRCQRLQAELTAARAEAFRQRALAQRDYAPVQLPSDLWPRGDE